MIFFSYDVFTLMVKLPGWIPAARLDTCCRVGYLLPGWIPAAGLDTSLTSLRLARSITGGPVLMLHLILFWAKIKAKS